MDWMQLLFSSLAVLLISFISNCMFPKAAGLTAERVSRNYNRYSPEANQSEPIISTDQKSALLPTSRPDGELGIVTALGGNVVCRTLMPDETARWHFDKGTITLKHGDFTQPTVKFRLSEADFKRAAAAIQAHSPQNISNNPGTAHV
ncbi:MAG: hypothetical protein KUG56_08545 [Kordiimonadaceae bacterium]|nr:hypothetical protein [Kordiimonadaceae bacterium]